MEGIKVMTHKFLFSCIFGKIETIKVHRWIVVLVLVEICPSLPKLFYKLSVHERGIIHQIVNLFLELIISSHIVSQLEGQDKLKGFKRSVFHCIIAVEKVSDQFTPTRSLSCGIDHAVSIVNQMLREIYHCLFD